MPERDRETILATPGTKLVDSDGRMLLVDAPERSLTAVVEELGNWLVTPEQLVSLPDPRPMPRRRPGY